MPRLLLLFLDEPVPGKVLPGVEETAGPDMAVRSYRAMVRVLLRQLAGLEQCRLRICCAPDDGLEAIKFWILPEILEHSEIDLNPDEIDFVPQGPGDQATRWSQCFDAASADGFDHIASISSDCIEVSSRWVNAAFSQLNGRHHGAVGPTPSGRCHLLALRTPLPPLFEAVAWDQENVLSSLLEQAERTGHSLYQLPPLTDIRTEADFNKALLGPLGHRLRKATKDLTNNGF